MKNKINIVLLFLIPIVMLSCDEDDGGVFSGPTNLFIDGAGSTTPTKTGTYLIGDVLDPESYTWSVEGPAEIVGSPTGNSVTVQFNSVGTVTISVTNGAEDTGVKAITVAKVAPAIKVSFGAKSTGALGSGDKDTVFFEFAAPLVDDPTIAMNTDTSGFIPDKDAFVSGSLSGLTKVSDTKYYAIYTAGEGDGVPEAIFSGVEAVEEFGGLLTDSLEAYVQLFQVDNIAPLVSVTYDDELVNDSTVVTVTATFTEPITSTEYVTDSVILISFSGAGVEEETDTLQPTSDPTVYTYEYTVNGEGNGAVMVDFVNIIDLAGNPVERVENDPVLVVDNTDPVITSGTAIDNGTHVLIELTSTEAATGMYLILEDGEDDPTTAEEFMEASGVESGEMPLSAGVPKSHGVPLAPGEYDVYYLLIDEAGNYSDISSSDLTMD